MVSRLRPIQRVRQLILLFIYRKLLQNVINFKQPDLSPMGADELKPSNNYNPQSRIQPAGQINMRSFGRSDNCISMRKRQRIFRSQRGQQAKSTNNITQFTNVMQGFGKNGGKTQDEIKENQQNLGNCRLNIPAGDHSSNCRRNAKSREIKVDLQKYLGKSLPKSQAEKNEISQNRRKIEEGLQKQDKLIQTDESAFSTNHFSGQNELFKIGKNVLDSCVRLIQFRQSLTSIAEESTNQTSDLLRARKSVQAQGLRLLEIRQTLNSIHEEFSGLPSGDLGWFQESSIPHKKKALNDIQNKPDCHSVPDYMNRTSIQQKCNEVRRRLPKSCLSRLNNKQNFEQILDQLISITSLEINLSKEVDNLLLLRGSLKSKDQIQLDQIAAELYTFKQRLVSNDAR